MLGPSSDLSPIGRVPECRDHNMEEEVEDGGVNLDHFNFSLGYQTKLLGQMNISISISLTNLFAAPPSPSGVRGGNYSPSHNDSHLSVTIGEQVLAPRKFPPSQ